MKKWIGAAVCALCAALLAAGVPVIAAPPADTVPDASASAQDTAAAAAAAVADNLTSDDGTDAE